MTSILNDATISTGVSKMLQRAERIADIDRLAKTYVEVGVVPQLQNTNNQIIFGRRGTGKTHLFRYLGNELRTREGSVALYLDCRTLGSATDFSNTSIVLERRAKALFKDIVFELVEAALGHIAENAPADSEKALAALDEIEQAVTTKNEQTTSREITDRTLVKTGSESETGVSLSAKEAISLKLGSKTTDGADIERTTKYTAEGGDKVEFPDLHFWLKRLCESIDTDIYLLIDEWSSIPSDLQPLLSEFLKRSFLPVPRITIKIAALEYRSHFRLPDSNTGFELGSDIASNLDLDDHFVFDRNPTAITETFAEILFRHVVSGIEPGYFEKQWGVKNSADFLKVVFTNSENFRELVRASEGVVRDMINIFTNAYFESRRLGKSKVDKKTIIESSRKWFEQDKAPNLDDDLQKVLRKIVNEVIGKRRARSFLIPRELEKHDTIQRLFDARVLHLIRRGYADKDTPGLRYNVFGLDYGTYVDLINTNQQPELNLVDVAERQESEDVIVPFDDSRSIRRIILSAEVLNY